MGEKGEEPLQLCLRLTLFLVALFILAFPPLVLTYSLAQAKHQREEQRLHMALELAGIDAGKIWPKENNVKGKKHQFGIKGLPYVCTSICFE